MGSHGWCMKTLLFGSRAHLCILMSETMSFLSNAGPSCVVPESSHVVLKHFCLVPGPPWTQLHCFRALPFSVGALCPEQGFSPIYVCTFSHRSSESACYVPLPVFVTPCYFCRRLSHAFKISSKSGPFWTVPNQKVRLSDPAFKETEVASESQFLSMGLVTCKY